MQSWRVTLVNGADSSSQFQFVVLWYNWLSLYTLWARAARSAPSPLLIFLHTPWHSSSLKVTFPPLRVKASRKFPFKIHISRSSLVLQYCALLEIIRAWAPNEDTSSVILQGCDYTLCFLLVSHCTNILFAATTWLLKHFKHHSEVTALKFKTYIQLFFFLHIDKALAYKDKGASQRMLQSKRNELLLSPQPRLIALTNSSSPITFLMNCKKWVSSHKLP